MKQRSLSVDSILPKGSFDICLTPISLAKGTSLNNRACESNGVDNPLDRPFRYPPTSPLKHVPSKIQRKKKRKYRERERERGV